jgi:hypothetical protein
MLDRKHAIRGGVSRDAALVRQTSLTVVGALAVMVVLMASPTRVGNSPPPRLQPGVESRVQIDPDSPVGRALTAARAVLPVFPPILPKSRIPNVPPAVSIWRGQRISGGVTLNPPSDLPPPSLSGAKEHNLTLR